MDRHTPSTALYTLIILRIWQFGSPMLIFLAGLKQIPQELYEASEIDGASSVAKFFRITLPLADAHNLLQPDHADD